jgi:hypothetical protein
METVRAGIEYRRDYLERFVSGLRALWGFTLARQNATESHISC